MPSVMFNLNIYDGENYLLHHRINISHLFELIARCRFGILMIFLVIEIFFQGVLIFLKYFFKMLGK